PNRRQKPLFPQTKEASSKFRKVDQEFSNSVSHAARVKQFNSRAETRTKIKIEGNLNA
ncbi:MAG: hypothetical protein ACI85U_004132, partial [Candidatus Promineifilaceae bacterium]